MRTQLFLITLLLTHYPICFFAEEKKGLADCERTYIEMKRSIQVAAGQKQSLDHTFFSSLEESLNAYYDDLAAKAKRYLASECYEEARIMYENILAAIEKGCYPKVKGSDSLLCKKIRYRIAECHFLASDYELSLAACGNLKNTGQKIDHEMLFLSALCYREKQEYEKALACFETYTSFEDANELAHYEQAIFEIGFYYYQREERAKAAEYFEILQQFDTKPSRIAAIYLARLYLDEKSPHKAERILSRVITALEPNDPLCYECFYLRGMANYQLGFFSASKDFFELALCEKGVSWWRSTLYHLGWCNLRLGDDPNKNGQTVRGFFAAAEKIFADLADDECAVLSLAQLYLVQYRTFGQQLHLKQLEDLLAAKASLFSLEGRVQALLLRAEGASIFHEREKFYKLATDNANAKASESYAQAWYCQGINYFQEGLKDPDLNFQYFEMAAKSFDTAFNLIEKKDIQLAAAALKLEAKATMYRHTPLTSLALLEKLLNEFEESVEDREETLYLRGMLAAHFTDLTYFPIAEESLKRVIAHYPHGRYITDALFALGNLYYARGHFNCAKEIFSQLAREHSSSPHAAEAWFLVAESSALIGEDPLPYLIRTYENYPCSLYAPEAYFRQFSWDNYKHGTPEALAHLKSFKTHFPHASLLVAASYFLGLHEKGRAKVEAFEMALKAFNEQLQSPDERAVYFRYESILELAALYLNSEIEGDLARCEKLLTTLLDEFLLKGHPLASFMTRKTSYPSQFERGEFSLARCYLKMHNTLAAQRLFTHMLSHYNAAGIGQGYILSQVWQQLGSMSLECHDPTTALQCFENAHSSGASCISDEQRLGLWILQSEAFRAKKDYDMAMRYLSRVSNTEIDSPLRFKAMYLRSEIYELAGRRELAIRQLESVAKKEGEWAQKAREQLEKRNHHVFE